MKPAEIRSKTNHELEVDLAKSQKELFSMRFKSATESSNNPARIAVLRKKVARIQTVLGERATKIRGQEPR